MSELISRAALLAEYDKHHVGAPGGARKLIEEAPTIDAVPVVHGRWCEAAGGRTICNHCGEYPLYDYFGRQKLSRSCPNCGAKMDEGKEISID